jgi:hypothetical protein
MRLLFSTFMLLATVGSQAQNRVYSVCDALENRKSINHQLITVKGVQIASDEGAWLERNDCRPLAVAGYDWPTSIWLELSDKRRKEAGFESTDLELSVRRINEKIRYRHYDPKRDRLWLTYVGVFETYDDGLEKHVYVDSSGSRGVGFGHLNRSPAELIVKDVLDVSVEHPGAREPK